MATHYLPYFCETVGVRQRAACGALIVPSEHSTEPACEPCCDYLTSEQLALAVADEGDKAEREKGLR